MFETTNQMIYHDIHPFSDTALWELPHAHHMELCSDELKAGISLKLQLFICKTHQRFPPWKTICQSAEAKT